MTATSSAFSGKFRSELQIGKYTSWAADLNADTLQTLLWACGEFGVRAASILYRVEGDTLSYSPPILHENAMMNARICTSLRLIHAITSGQNIKLPAATALVRAGMAAGRPKPDCDPRLTAVLKGCSIRSIAREGSMQKILFSDGTALEVESGSGPLPTAPVGVVQEVSFSEGGIELIFSDGSTLWMSTPEEAVALKVGTQQGARL